MTLSIFISNEKKVYRVFLFKKCVEVSSPQSFIQCRIFSVLIYRERLGGLIGMVCGGFETWGTLFNPLLYQLS
jgi:hypothetical protein